MRILALLGLLAKVACLKCPSCSHVAVTNVPWTVRTIVNPFLAPFQNPKCGQELRGPTAGFLQSGSRHTVVRIAGKLGKWKGKRNFSSMAKEKNDGTQQKKEDETAVQYRSISQSPVDEDQSLDTSPTSKDDSSKSSTLEWKKSAKKRSCIFSTEEEDQMPDPHFLTQPRAGHIGQNATASKSKIIEKTCSAPSGKVSRCSWDKGVLAIKISLFITSIELAFHVSARDCFYDAAAAMPQDGCQSLRDMNEGASALQSILNSLPSQMRVFNFRGQHCVYNQTYPSDSCIHYVSKIFLSVGFLCTLLVHF